MRPYSWRGFAKVFLQVVCERFFDSVVSKKPCVGKVLLAIWQIFLNQNKFNYNSWRFCIKFCFIHFSKSWWSGHKKYFYSLFIASRPLLQNYSEFNRILYKDFITVHVRVHWLYLKFWCLNLVTLLISVLKNLSYLIQSVQLNIKANTPCDKWDTVLYIHNAFSSHFHYVLWKAYKSGFLVQTTYM